MSSADGMRCFTFSSPLLPGAGVRLSQDSSKSIGFKLYPAALVLCRYIEESSCGGGGAAPSAASALLSAAGARPRVLELGAGVCGLPSLLLAARGAAATATDAGDVVAGLRANEHQKEEAYASLERARAQTYRYVERFVRDPEFVRDQARERMGVAEPGEIVIRVDGARNMATPPKSAPAPVTPAQASR